MLSKLDLSNTQSKLLAIVANLRGAEEACRHEAITYLGYPFSISEGFQMRNTNTTIADAFDTVKKVKALCTANNKDLLVYLSMGFGNPYGDEWSIEIIERWTEKLVDEGIGIVALSDTIGIATPDQISSIYPRSPNGSQKQNLAYTCTVLLKPPW
ncbi:hypothetical protein [Mucilaginibacter antarcticus]|uniref:hypothetical protein n=1 Tax=Mucilaginibacter antarcticus TaxID=1855725 RepID=UPI003641D11C